MGRKPYKAQSGGQMLTVPMMAMLRRIKNIPDKHRVFRHMIAAAHGINDKYRRMKAKLRKR